jgi:hypothetical protein
MEFPIYFICKPAPYNSLTTSRKNFAYFYLLSRRDSIDFLFQNFNYTSVIKNERGRKRKKQKKKKKAKKKEKKKKKKRRNKTL